jgi:outer membrane protein assembly factor BamB
MSRFSWLAARRLWLCALGAALLPPFVVAALPAGATGTDAAVTYQGDALHNGSQADTLAPPLTKAWSDAFSGPVSYSVIAGGMAYVTVATNPSSYGTTLEALNLSSGVVQWSLPLGGTYFWSALAYDGGQLFALDYNGQLTALNASTGAENWSVQLPGQYAFTSPPTAANGYVYTGGAGSGGTVYAVSESTGAIAWTASVMNGDESSPVVTSSGVYVSYACQQAYDFAPATGALIWHHTSSCEGGGGRTPALVGNQLYVRDPVLGNVVLDASTGAGLGTFAAGPIPALTSSLGYFLSGGTLWAQGLSGGAAAWSFAGDGTLSSAPVVANGVVYEGGTSGSLYALSASTGAVLWSGNVGSAIPAPDEQNVSQPLTGMAIGQGMLLVPATDSLVAYAGTPDFSISAQPAQLRFKKKSSASSTISLTANSSFSGSVSLLTNGAPSWAKVTLRPSSVSLSPGGTSSSVLTISTSGASTGSFTVSVQGCGGGTCHAVPVAVTVTS